jgi:hypothetical protein
MVSRFNLIELDTGFGSLTRVAYQGRNPAKETCSSSPGHIVLHIQTTSPFERGVHNGYKGALPEQGARRKCCLSENLQGYERIPQEQ